MRNCAIPLATGLSGDEDSSLRLRLATGTWRGFCTTAGDQTFGHVWPFAYTQPSVFDWRPNLDGSYPLFPIVLLDHTPNIYGELDGMYATTGFSQSVENTITINGIPHLVVQNVFRNTKADFFAVRLS
jgi:hypothetical protein